MKSTDLKFEKNTVEHHTDEYELCDPQDEYDDDTGKPKRQQLVVRRGQDIEFSVTFDRNYDKDKDDLKLALEYHCKF